MTDKTDSKERGSIISSSDILLHDAKTALMYEELRAAIDDGHESMTHADALAEIAAIRAENEQLRAQLESIGAGGVSGPLMGRTDSKERAGRFTKKPVTIDAWLIDFRNKPLPDWVNEAFRTEAIDWCPSGEGLYINTLEGHMLGANGSWLIKGVQGELYACKPDIFAATYERASLAASAGSEPVAWVDERALSWLANSRSLSATITTKLEKGKSFERPMPLYLHPSPPEGMVGGWIALPGTLPEPGVPVLLDIGKKYPIRAMWAAKHTVEAADDDTDWGEYDEATETYYCPEGWYEWNEHEDTNWAVSATPRAWAPLPPTSSADSRKGE